jgi:diphthine-ammonia ligase
MTKVFVSWSGGKDCSLALYRAKKQGFDIRCLANTVTEDGKRSRSHGMTADVIRKQAEAMDIPIMQRPVSRDTYEAGFTDMMRTFKKEGMEGGVFGDIDFNAHLEWIQRVCKEAGMTPHLPLWLENQDKLMKEFIDAGFEAVVVAAMPEFFGEEILGQKVDSNFVRMLKEMGKTKPITTCGEAGEYHTLVINGPTFKKRLEIVKSEKTEREGRLFLEILEVKLKGK